MVDVSPTPPPIPGKPAHRNWLPLLKYGVAPFFAFVGSVVTGHYQGQAKKNEAVKESTKVTDTAYLTVAPKTDILADRLQELEKSVAKIADTVQLQGKLLLATQPGFTTGGTVATPAQVRHKRKAKSLADPKLVTQVQQSAVRGLEEIKARVEETPPIAPLPATLPKEPPQAAATP